MSWNAILIQFPTGFFGILDFNFSFLLHCPTGQCHSIGTNKYSLCSGTQSNAFPAQNSSLWMLNNVGCLECHFHLCLKLSKQTNLFLFKHQQQFTTTTKSKLKTLCHVACKEREESVLFEQVKVNLSMQRSQTCSSSLRSCNLTIAWTRELLLFYWKINAFPLTISLLVFYAITELSHCFPIKLISKIIRFVDKFWWFFFARNC